jgi:hypothetical protein
MTARERVRRNGAAAVLVGLFLLAGCSSSGGSDDAASSVANESTGDADSGGGGSAAPTASAADGASADSGGGRSSLAVDTVALATRREVIRTGEMWVTVDGVEDATDDVRKAADDVDGFVSDEQVQARDGQADVTVRVPADDFDDVRADVARVGDVREQKVAAEDVTAEMVDVDTRIESLRASVDRLQGLLERAGDVAQLASVEGELATRETELEAMLGQQRVLRDQVALATLTVHLSEKDEGPAPSDDAAGFTDGLRQGWATAVDVGRACLAAVGFLLPFLPVIALALLAWRLLLRRRARPTPSPAITP